MNTPHKLNGEQLGILKKLVAVPSWNDPERGIDETAVLELIEELLQDCGCKVWRMHYSDTEWNLVAEKGKTGIGGRCQYLAAHVDTVSPNDSGEPACKLTIDGNSLHGLGVWDMKGGVMGIVDVLRRIEVPDGMKTVGVFLRNEELESRGMLALVEWLHQQREREGNSELKHPHDLLSPQIVAEIREWFREHPKQMREHHLPDPDLFLFPEIPTSVRPYTADQIPITIERDGHVKTEVGLSNEVAGGHASSQNGVNVPNEFIYLACQLLERFSRYRVSDPRLEKEQLRFKEIITPEEPHHSIVNNTRAYLSHLIRTTTIADSIKWQAEQIRGIACQLGFKRKGIGIEFGQTLSRTSYPSYAYREDSRLAQAVLAVVNDVNGKIGKEGVFSYGGSTADGNLLHAAGYKTVDCSAKGGGAHSKDEHIEGDSLAENIKLLEEAARGKILDRYFSNRISS